MLPMALPHDIHALLLAVAAASGSPSMAAALDVSSVNLSVLEVEAENEANANSVVGRLLASRARAADYATRAHRRLRDDLGRMGAHPALALWADEAADDAKAHAAALRKLAARYDTHDRALTSRAPDAAPRTLEQLAEDNLTTGCVHGTFDALVALHQGRSATDRELAELMTNIGNDEIRHAALAFAVHAFVEPKLSEAARARLVAIREQAATALVSSLHQPPRADVARLAGVPSVAEARALAADLGAALWT